MTALTAEQRLTGIEVRCAELVWWRHRAAIELEGWIFDGAPIRPGQLWPQRDGLTRFAHPEVDIPAEWPIEACRLQLDLGGEGLLRLRYPDGRQEGFGLNPYHAEFPLLERQYSIEAEVVARLPFGVPNRGAALGRTRLVWLETALVRLLRRLRLVIELARALQDHEAIDALIAIAERALHALNWPSETGSYLARTAESPLMLAIWQLPVIGADHVPLDERERASVVEADEGLQAGLATLQARYPQVGRLAITGQAHLDLAWLWPMEETRRKARRTFHTAISLMNRYSEFIFHQSSAQVYAFVEQDEPKLFQRIVEKAGAGQWEPIGGMWVEPDANMTAGESLARQLLYGQRYFKGRFGHTHTVCWMPDCFGFTPALPQLLRLAGIPNFFTIKLTWSETNRFPHDLFWWEGLDGSRVLAHLFDNPGNPADPNLSGYNGAPDPPSILSTWRNYGGKHCSPESLLSIGYGDGGGGVTDQMIEQMRDLQDFPVAPSLAFSTVQGFFERTRTAIEGQTLPVWVGELYLELHRGTLTTQGRTKWLHRRAEHDLVAAEVAASLLHLAGGPEPHSLEEQWRVLLRNQFHDILPGSSIREVYQQAEQELTRVLDVSNSVMEGAIAGLSELLLSPGDQAALLLVNPDLSPRPVRAELENIHPLAQKVEDGSVFTSTEMVPPLGASAINYSRPVGRMFVSPEHLENDQLRVELDANGTLARVYDKAARREVLAGRGNQIWAYLDKPRKWDAWDLDESYLATGTELRELESIEVVENGPHRVTVRVIRRFRASRIVQDVRLWANSRRLEFKTTIDWHDRRWLLKARFPLAIRSSHAIFETAFGVVERPTHRNTSWDAARFEVAGHRFADLSEPGYGVALLNDGKYGHHAIGNELGLSLLRSPAYPDPLADEGTQVFTYALYPHAGGWLEGGVLMEAEDLNRPLLARPCQVEREVSWQPIRIDGLQLGLGTLKAMEDGGGLVLRSYEPQGARGVVRVTVPEGWSLGPELDLLENETGEMEREFTPFQVHSWLLRRPP